MALVGRASGERGSPARCRCLRAPRLDADGERRARLLSRSPCGSPRATCVTRSTGPRARALSWRPASRCLGRRSRSRARSRSIVSTLTIVFTALVGARARGRARRARRRMDVGGLRAERPALRPGVRAAPGRPLPRRGRLLRDARGARAAARPLRRDGARARSRRPDAPVDGERRARGRRRVGHRGVS